MAIIIPILTNYSDRGMKQAFRDVQTADNKFRAFGSAASTAFMAAGVGAGLFAAKLGVDAVKAAIDEEAELARLNNTLSTLGFADASESVNAFVDDLRFATGVADSELRPSLDVLVRATNDVGRAQNLLALATDISAQKQIALSSVVNALAKAEDGSTTALGKLNLGIDKNVLKGQAAIATFSQLADLYGGAAAKQASTLQGTLARLTDGVGELSEAAGGGFLDAFQDALGGTDDAGKDLAQTLRDLQPAAERLGKIFGDYFGDVGVIATGIMDLASAFDDLGDSSDFARVGIDSMGEAMIGVATGPVVSLIGQTADLVNWIRQIGAESRISLLAWQALKDARAGGLGDYAPGAATSSSYTAASGELNRYVSYLQNAGAAQLTLSTNASKAAKAAVEAAKAALAAQKQYGGSGSSGGTAGAVDKLTKAQKLAQAAFAALADSVEYSKAALDSVGQSLEDARQKLIDYADTTRDWLVSGINIGDAVKTWMEDVATIKELDAKIAAAIADGDEEGAAKLAAERAGINTAASWWDGFQQQIADSKAAAKAIDTLVASLNPADTLGNELLLDQIRGMKPAEALAAIDYLITNSLGPAAAAGLSETFGGAGQVGTAIATAFYGSGVTAAEAQYGAIKTTLEGKLEALYALGKQMGDKVAAGWNAAVANLPADVRLPGGAGGTVNNVTVQAGVGDPVAIAKTVVDVLAQAARRTR